MRAAVWGIALLCPLLLLSGCARTPWPAYMAQLPAGVSESPVAAVLPDGGEVIAPHPSLAGTRARWHGVWRGWACQRMLCDARLAIEQVTADRAVVAVATASGLGNRLSERATGVFEGDELTVRLQDGGRLVLRLRADGDMELARWRADAQLQAAGVLSQRPEVSAYVRTVERIPTPRAMDDRLQGGQRQDDPRQTLEMVVYRPAGPGPFPTLVFNHGSTGRGNEPARLRLTWTSPEVARHFTSRGWLVLFPQRRGRGTSDGVYDEGFSADRTRGYTCETGPSLTGFARALEDLDAVMAAVRGRPDVIAERVLIGGVSRGGILAVGYAGRHPDRFIGVLNLVGGWVGDRCPTASAINQELARGGAPFGKPMLWLYGDRDPFYAIGHSEANFDAFRTAGGLGDFIAIDPAPGRTGHEIDRSPALWTAAVERYLNALGTR